MKPPDPARLACSMLMHEAIDWDANADAVAIRSFLDFGRDHGVLPLLDAELGRRGDSASWPDEIRLTCHQAMLAQTAHELAHAAEIERVLAALDRANVKPLLLKGTGLAYSLYLSPALRPRSDTDLLVPPESRDAALKVLRELGYSRTGGPAGRYVGYQQQMQRVDARSVIHNIDLHWRISDVQAFAWLFGFDELAAASLPVPGLDPIARRVGNAHALLHSLLHRAGNNRYGGAGFGDRLIWLYDMQVLVAAMTDVELDGFCNLAESKRLGAVVLEGLNRCAEGFPSARLSGLIQALAKSAGAESGRELLAIGRLRREWMEFRAIPGPGRRLAWLAARVFPTEEYMRERFPEATHSSIALLHVRRWVRGLREFLL